MAVALLRYLSQIDPLRAVSGQASGKRRSERSAGVALQNVASRADCCGDAADVNAMDAVYGRQGMEGQMNAVPGSDAVAEATQWSSAAMLERLGGDEELARQLVTLFLAEYPKLMANLHASIASGSADSVRRAGHAAKGCIANFIDGGPQTTAYRIEQLGVAGKLGDVPALVAQLEREIASLATQMTAFEQEGSCAS